MDFDFVIVAEDPGDNLAVEGRLDFSVGIPEDLDWSIGWTGRLPLVFSKICFTWVPPDP